MNSYRVITNMVVGAEGNMATFDVDADHYEWPRDGYGPLTFWGEGDDIRAVVSQSNVVMVVKRP